MRKHARTISSRTRGRSRRHIRTGYNCKTTSTGRQRTRGCQSGNLSSWSNCVALCIVFQVVLYSLILLCMVATSLPQLVFSYYMFYSYCIPVLFFYGDSCTILIVPPFYILVFIVAKGELFKSTTYCYLHAVCFVSRTHYNLAMRVVDHMCGVMCGLSLCNCASHSCIGSLVCIII